MKKVIYYNTPVGVCKVFIKADKHWTIRIYWKFIDWKNEVEIHSMIWFKKISVIQYLYYLLLSKF